jgi:hypothetical protein
LPCYLNIFQLAQKLPTVLELLAEQGGVHAQVHEQNHDLFRTNGAAIINDLKLETGRS